MSCLSRPLVGLCLTVVGASALPLPARAQEVEVGGVVGSAGGGSESDVVALDALHGLAGAYGSVWWTARFETAVRVAWFYEPDVTRGSRHHAPLNPGPDSSSVLETRRGSRQLISINASYHFRQEAVVRPYVGIGFGVIRDQLLTFCEVAGCEASAPQVPFGRSVFTHKGLIATGGVSKTLYDRLVLRGGIRWHTPGGEDLSIVEVSLGVGYRLAG